MFQKKFLKLILTMFCFLFCMVSVQCEKLYAGDEATSGMIIKKLMEKYPDHSEAELSSTMVKIQEVCPQSVDKMADLWLMDDLVFLFQGPLIFVRPTIMHLCDSIDRVLQIRSLGVSFETILVLGGFLTSDSDQYKQRCQMSDNEWSLFKDLTEVQSEQISYLIENYSNLSWDKFRQLNNDYRQNSYKIYKLFAKKRIDVNDILFLQSRKIDFEEVKKIKKSFKDATFDEFLEVVKKGNDISRIQEFSNYFPDDTVSEFLKLDLNCDLHLHSLQSRGLPIEKLIEDKTGCSYLWKGFGKRYRKVEDHGDNKYYKCLTCGGNIFNKTTICPQCMKTCHKDKGHDVEECKIRPDSAYYCDCGAGGMDCCFIDKFVDQKKMDAIPFTQNIQLFQYLKFLQNVANKENPFVLGTLGIDYLFGALSSLQSKKDLPIINQSNLKVGVYYYNLNTVDDVPKGIFHTDDIVFLNQTIFNQTKFNVALDQSVEEALVTVVRSNELFEKSFPKKYTSNRDFYSNDGDKKSILMMHDSEKSHYRYLRNKRVFGVELPYISGGSLVLMMPNPNLQDNILDFDAIELEGSIKELLASEVNTKTMPLTVPKFTVESTRSMGSQLKETFPERRSLLERFEDDKILQAARFEISEQGTKGESVMLTWIPKGEVQEVEEIVFNRPFLAIVLDKEKRPSFISYITF